MGMMTATAEGIMQGAVNVKQALAENVNWIGQALQVSNDSISQMAFSLGENMMASMTFAIEIGAENVRKAIAGATSAAAETMASAQSAEAVQAAAAVIKAQAGLLAAQDEEQQFVAQLAMESQAEGWTQMAAEAGALGLATVKSWTQSAEVLLAQAEAALAAANAAAANANAAAQVVSSKVSPSLGVSDILPDALMNSVSNSSQVIDIGGIDARGATMSAAQIEAVVRRVLAESGRAADARLRTGTA
jgi:hypothetical protein